MTVALNFVLMLAASFDAWQLIFMLAVVGLLILWSITWNGAMHKTPREPIGTCHFADGRARYVYEDDAGQFVTGHDGRAVYGVWLRPEEATDEPIIVLERK